MVSPLTPRIDTIESNISLNSSGTYTPTASNFGGTCTNATAAAGTDQYYWIKVGSILIVGGRVDVTTSGSGAFTFDLTLPAAVVNNFASDNKAHGNFQGAGNAYMGLIKCVSGDKKLRFSGFAGGAATTETRWTVVVQIP